MAAPGQSGRLDPLESACDPQLVVMGKQSGLLPVVIEAAALLAGAGSVAAAWRRCSSGRRPFGDWPGIRENRGGRSRSRGT